MDIWKGNSFYWSYRDRPILLLGGSDEDNLFNHPQLWHNLDVLRACGGNYVRCTMSSRDEGNVWPYAKVRDQYDLNRFNPEYWSRLQRFLELAHEREVIVQIEFWDRFDFAREPWRHNPYNPALNVNYTVETTHLVPEWDFHPAQNTPPFFLSPPSLNNDEVLLHYQQAFVRRVLDATLDYDNILYCLDNETSAPRESSWYWAEFILDEVQRRGKRIHLTEMWDAWDLRHEHHQATYERSDLFSFVDISQNNWQAGQTHYDRILWMRDRLQRSETGPRPMNNVKVYGRPQPRVPAELSLSLDRWWQNIFGGCASTRFHRPDSGLGLNEIAQRMIRAARVFTDAFDIFHCAPHPVLLDEREENEAYCLAIPGRVYALYFPTGGDVVLHTEGGPFTLRWFDVETATFGQPEHVGTGDLRLRTPDASRMWLALVQAEGIAG
ncbi:MAG: hypothetical protein J7M34_07055 [Anaerolineae bacterium]|nr:hypothetical protein [Anaerolineae bacterium]